MALLLRGSGLAIEWPPLVRDRRNIEYHWVRSGWEFQRLLVERHAGPDSEP